MSDCKCKDTIHELARDIEELYREQKSHVLVEREVVELRERNAALVMENSRIAGVAMELEVRLQEATRCD